MNLSVKIGGADRRIAPSLAINRGPTKLGNAVHIAKVDDGVADWNQWRIDNPGIQPNLTRADLSRRDLSGIDFRGVGLFKANLIGTNLTDANLRQARLVSTNFTDANLSSAHVFGTSVWDVDLTNAIQRDLVITPPGDTVITVDDLEVAQFVYLLVNNAKLRRVIDTLTSKVVLILGRFKPERKAILDRIKSKLREHGFLPVLFDFDGPENRDLTETVSTLAYLARFVIADLTLPACIPQELSAIVPHIRIPVIPLIQKDNKPYAMFNDLLKYEWLHAPLVYVDKDDVVNSILITAISQANEYNTKLGRLT